MMKDCFPDAKQIKKPPKITVFKEFTYVQKDRSKIDENFDSPPDNKLNFSASYFYEVPIVNVENIKESLKEMNSHRVQKKIRIIISRI